MTKEWETEPDYEFFHEAGLPCVINRGPSDSLCGYVGIPASHPWHGKEYNAEVKVPKAIAERNIDPEQIGYINLLLAALKENRIGEGYMDLVLALDVHGGVTYSRKMAPNTSLEGYWWIGFDCAHAGDLSPKEYASGYAADGVYRNIEYVRSQCQSLARQLSAVQ